MSIIVSKTVMIFVFVYRDQAKGQTSVYWYNILCNTITKNSILWNRSINIIVYIENYNIIRVHVHSLQSIRIRLKCIFYELISVSGVLIIIIEYNIDIAAYWFINLNEYAFVFAWLHFINYDMILSDYDYCFLLLLFHFVD